MFYTPIWEFEGCQLVQRPDTPNYFIYWNPRKPPGRALRQSTRTSDLDTAKRKLVEFVRQRSDRAILKRSAENTLLLEVLCEYVEPKLATKRPFFVAAATALKHFAAFLEHDGINTVAEFGLDAQRRYIAWRQRQLLAGGFSASNGTLNRELGVAKAALRSAWKRGALETIPHIEMLPTPPPRDRFLRAHEVRRLMAECTTPHLKLFVMLALHTLQRPIAIFSLTIDQVDLDWNRIDFLPPGTIQSNKRRPVLPITPSLRPYLEDAVTNSSTGFVLEFMDRPIRSVKHAFRRACDRAGLEDVTPYVLRHTGATLMAAAGVPLRQIAAFLGHSETKTTEIYAKHHPDFLHNASRAIELLFGDGAMTNGNAGNGSGTNGNTPSLLRHSSSRANLAPNGDEHPCMDVLEAAESAGCSGAAERD